MAETHNLSSWRVVSLEKDADKDWIQKAVKRPGQLHKDLGVPEGEKIPEDKLEDALHSDDEKVRERAQFAENMKGIGKGKKSGAEGYRTKQWECPQCGIWNYEYAGARGGADWHDCEQCGYSEKSPMDFNRRQAPEGWNEDDQGRYDYDEGWVPMDRMGTTKEALGEMQQPSAVGPAQGEHEMELAPEVGEPNFQDVPENSRDQNVAFETWVNNAIDHLNRGLTEEEVLASLAHDGCPDPQAVLKRAIEQPYEDDFVGSDLQDPFDSPYIDDTLGQDEQSVHVQPPTPVTGKVRIVGTSMIGTIRSRTSDMWGHSLVKVALDGGDTINVAPSAVESYIDQADPVSEIEQFIESIPEAFPTHAAIEVRMAGLDQARRKIVAVMSKVAFSDQVKLQEFDLAARDEILDLKEQMRYLAPAGAQEYLASLPRFSPHSEEIYTNPRFASRLNEEAAVFVAGLDPVVAADNEQLAYSALRYAEDHNAGVRCFDFVAAVQRMAWDKPWEQDEGGDDEEKDDSSGEQTGKCKECNRALDGGATICDTCEKG